MSQGCLDPQIGRLIGAYELNLLPRQDVEAFEEHLSSCPGCVDELYEHAVNVTTMHLEADAILRQTVSEVESVPETSPELIAPVRRAASKILGVLRPSRGRWSTAIPAGVMAAALVVIFSTVVDRGGRLDLPELARVEPFAYVPLETRDLGSYEELELGLRKYHEHEYESAIQHLEQGLDRVGDEAFPDRNLFVLYLGVAYLLSEEPEKALTHLEDASVSPLPVVADRARWYLAQANLLTGDVKTAMRLLEGLAASSPGYAEKARQQLQIIRERTGQSR